MKNIIHVFLMLLMANCWGWTQENDCARVTNFGKAEICLPQIEGYKECYSDTIVKQLADGTEVPENMVLGFYLTDQVYAKKDSIGLFKFDDYFKVYGTRQVKDYEADTQALQELQAMLTGSFISRNWNEMEKEIDGIGLDIEIGVPTVIKTYSLNDQSFTLVMLTKYQLEEEEPFTMAMSISGVLMSERLIWLAYYLDYTGEAAVSSLQEKSNIILNELLGSEE